MEESTWKQCGYFDYRYYIEKIRVNIEITPKRYVETTRVF